ncbi:MAG: amino-acid N-acetyltransferase [Myxococcota bacterium]
MSKESRPPGAGFIDQFRAAAPYVHAHRGRTFVVTFGGEALRSDDFKSLVHDIALMHGLGIQLVLVVGARPQIEERLALRGLSSEYHLGVRVTSKQALESVKEAAGVVRIEMEAQLSKGLANSPMAGARIRVSAGNFVSARPRGVVDGIDYQHTGLVRRVDAQAIEERLRNDAIVLLTCVGYSITGEAFNLESGDVAASAAIALSSAKLVCLVEGTLELPTRLDQNSAATTLDQQPQMDVDVRRHIEASTRAIRRGVRRAHLLERECQGALLLELFTREGAGTMVTDECWDDVRPATRKDVGGILALIEPLSKEGVLVRRTRKMLEADLNRFIVIGRDGLVLACAALHPYPEQHTAELACVAVHPKHREAGQGEKLLSYLEQRCREQGVTSMFVLTTQSDHWFLERGFEPGSVHDLPTQKRESYDRRRASKILIKLL